MALWMWMMGLALAQDPAIDAAAQQAEAIRLSDEIHRAARRNAWKGVERHYLRAVATGATLKAKDHFTAARASKHVGNLGAMRARLIAALKVEPTHTEASAELQALEATYARVDLRAFPGAVLEDYERPFDPLKLKAVDFAIETMGRIGRFDGLLPPGPYALNADPFELRAGQVFALDLSPPEPPPPPPVPIWKR